MEIHKKQSKFLTNGEDLVEMHEDGTYEFLYPCIPNNPDLSTYIQEVSISQVIEIIRKGLREINGKKRSAEFIQKLCSLLREYDAQIGAYSYIDPDNPRSRKVSIALGMNKKVILRMNDDLIDTHNLNDHINDNL